MITPIRRILKPRLATTLCAAWLCIVPALSVAQEVKKTPAPDLDLTIKYFNRELTPEGVLRVSRYEEKMLRRSGHVWSYRVLPGKLAANDTTLPSHEHKDFNYIVLPRHVKFDGSKVSVEFINTHDHQVINIVPTEYENVNFDGSWLNAYYLIDPKIVAAMPVSQRATSAANARWHEVLKNGLFQRVLWDEKMLIPLMIETGDQKNSFFQRISVSANARLIKDLPWSHQQGYTQKEYSDFLD
jgi:hypothetical protein